MTGWRIHTTPIASPPAGAASGRAHAHPVPRPVAHPAPPPRVKGLLWLVMVSASSCLFATAARAEDEAHRLDHLATQRLNRAALAARVAAPAPPAPAGQTLREREEAAIARWQATVDRCRDADRSEACRHAAATGAADLPKGAINDR